jgi:hypothetical protein
VGPYVAMILALTTITAALAILICWHFTPVGAARRMPLMHFRTACSDLRTEVHHRFPHHKCSRDKHTLALSTQ